MSGQIGSSSSGSIPLPPVRGTGPLQPLAGPVSQASSTSRPTSRESIGRTSRLSLNAARVGRYQRGRRIIVYRSRLPYRFYPRAFMPGWMLDPARRQERATRLLPGRQETDGQRLIPGNGSTNQDNRPAPGVQAGGGQQIDPAIQPTGGNVPAPGQDVAPTVDRDAKLAFLREKLPLGSRSALDAIADRLDQRDIRTGETMLDHLHRFARDGVDAGASNAGLTTEGLLGDLVRELANPGLIHQSNRGTCAATTAQYYMAINHPAEYARLVTDLMTTGKTTTASGAVYNRDDPSMLDDNSTRNAVDRVIQATLMDQSSAGDYDNATDRRTDGSGGMSSQDMTQLLRDMTNGVDGDMRMVSGNSTSILQRIADSTARGIEVPVGINWSQGGMHAKHALLVTGIQDGYVTLRNPWGSGDKGTLFNGPDRQVISGTGDIRMRLADFQRRLEVSVLA